MSFNRAKIQDCYLTSGDKQLPISRFELSFEIDELPAAQIIPAWGKQIGSNTAVSIGDIREGASAQLYIKVNGTVYLLLDGIVGELGVDDNAGLLKRRISGSLLLYHKAIVFSGSPPVSFVFAGNLTDITGAIFSRSESAPIGAPGKRTGTAVGVDMIYATASVLNGIFGSRLGLLAKKPMECFRYLSETLTQQNGITADRYTGILKGYATSELSENIGLDVDSALFYFLQEYFNNWVNTNVWNGLKAASNYTFLHLLPFNNGVFIAPANALIQTAGLTIKATEYSGVRAAIPAYLKEPIDGVALRIPGETGIPYTYFPPVEKGVINKFYHFVNTPGWLHTYLKWVYRKQPAKLVPTPDKTAPESKTWDGATIGFRIAKAMYAAMKEKRTTVALLMPFRMDVMPGTVIKVENTSSGSGFLGTTLYGMVSRTIFRCDMTTEQGQIGVEINISGVRTAADNGNTNLTYAEHPLYTAIWPGMYLDGSLLGGGSAGTPLTPTSNKTKNAVTGRTETKV